MKTSYSYNQFLDLIDSFQGLINIYNNQENSADIKTQSLKKINAVWDLFLKETSPSQNIAEEVINLLKKVNVQFNDIQLWNQLVGEIEKGFPANSDFNQLVLEGPLKQLPEELYLLIFEELMKMEDINTLAQTNHYLYSLLRDPRHLTHFLDKLSSTLSPEQRFQIALRCGKDLTALDLSFFQELDNKKLAILQKTCPNLQSLNLAYTPPLESSDFSILHSFSKLEKLNLSGTVIETLAMLPKTLEELNLSDCPNLVAEEFLNLDDSFSQLEKLDVSVTEIETLDKLPTSLKELYLNDCSMLTAEEFKKLSALSKLEKLNVANTQIETIGTLPKSLKELNLSWCESLTAPEFQKLDESFSKLEKLAASNTNIATLDIPKSLKEINLSHCIALSAQEFLKLNSFSNLKKLEVSGTWIESLDISKTIKELDLSHCLGLKTQEFQKLHSFADLKYLDLSWTNIEKLDMLPQHLKELNLSYCKNIDAEEFQKLHSFAGLEKLEASATQIAKLDSLPKSLKELYLSNCIGLSAQEFQKLDASFSKLEKLYASGTKIATLDQLPKSLKELSIICQSITFEEIKKLASFAKLQMIFIPWQFRQKEAISFLKDRNKQVLYTEIS